MISIKHQLPRLGTIDDTTIFVGLTSLPMSNEIPFNKELMKFVETHKYRTIKNLSSGAEDEEIMKLLYNPKSFYIFGPYDLALLSLIDDYEFCTQAFHPFDPTYPTGDEMNEKGSFYSDEDGEAGRRYFSHHLIVGPAPCWSTDQQQISTQANNSFIKILPEDPEKRKTFISRPLPLFGCCQLKLNDGLIIGAGVDFLKYVLRGIKGLFDLKYKKLYPNSNFQIIILNSWSWHEITVLIFSDSFNKIIEFVLELCDLTIGKTFDFLHENDNSFFKFRDSDCLISELIKKHKYENTNSKVDFSNTHIFLNSSTTLGFRFEIFEKGGPDEAKEEVLPIDPDDRIFPFSSWQTKAGHDFIGANLILGVPVEEAINKILVCTGRGDIVWPSSSAKISDYRIGFSEMQTLEYVDKIVKSRLQNKLEEHILLKNTIISFGTETLKKEDGTLKFNSLDPDRHYTLLTKEMKKRITIRISMIRKELYKPLRGNLIPKVILTRVLNTVALFNEGIDDPFLLSHFLELWPYLNTIIDKIKAIDERRFDENSNLMKTAYEINNMLEIFIKAWRNRYYSCHRLSDISDFNLEYKGGVQQLASAFDGSYKILTKSLTRQHDCLVIISGDPRISTSFKSIEINYFDIFMPEFFVSRATHEAGEAFLSYYKDVKSKDFEKHSTKYPDFFFLFNPANGNNIRELIEKAPTLKARPSSKLLDLYPRDDDDHKDNHLIVFFRDIFADTFNRRLTYGEDINLFLFWHRNMALSDPIFWHMPDKDKTMGHTHRKAKKDVCFFRMNILKQWLYRMVFQVVLADLEGNKSKQIECILDYWGHYPQINRKLINEIMDIILSLMNIQNISDGLNQMNLLLSEIVKDWSSRIDISPDKPLPTISHYDKILIALGNGEVYSADPEDLQNCYQFLQSLFRAYLKLVEGLATQGKKKMDPLLYRFSATSSDEKKAGEPLILDFENSFLFDRRGGVFLTNAETRRKYLRLRSAFTMTLWDLSAKWKYSMKEIRDLFD